MSERRHTQSKMHTHPCTSAHTPALQHAPHRAKSKRALRGVFTAASTSCERQEQQERARDYEVEMEALLKTVADRKGKKEQNAQETLGEKKTRNRDGVCGGAKTWGWKRWRRSDKSVWMCLRGREEDGACWNQSKEIMKLQWWQCRQPWFPVTEQTSPGVGCGGGTNLKGHFQAT